jgi:hypothetical protein
MEQLVLALLFQPLDLLTLAFQLGLIFIDLPLLPLLLIFLALELVANQRACTEAKHAADRRPSTRVSNRRADGTTCRGATQGADPCAFLPRRQRR